MIDVKEEQIRLLAKQLKIPTFADYKNILSDCTPDMDFSDLLLTLMTSGCICSYLIFVNR